MIEIYVHSGLVAKKPVIAMIMKAHTHRWLKTTLLHTKMTRKQVESVGVMAALAHISPKHKNKPIKIFVDSDYLITMLQKSKGEYVIRNSSVESMKLLREYLLDFPNVKICKMKQNDDKEELIHVYKECGLDGIELNERE